ncbi:hypothetical protein [Bordetella sp. FB-8]|uniref:hypothetical protein n=1 Tax=Bordetella sp. FB-8 TaxID=1159870 RepID=UPI001E2F0ABE|nr:hypothetical protein [Bordetella sp. FB-8]
MTGIDLKCFLEIRAKSARIRGLPEIFVPPVDNFGEKSLSKPRSTDGNVSK